MKRATVISAGVLAASAATLAIEAAIAFRVERLPAFDPAELNGTFGSGDGEPLRLVWLGDSTGDGVGASSAATALPRVVAAGLGRPVRLQVLAKSGATAADVLRDQVPRLAALDPGWVVVCVGGNDVTHLTSRGDFRRRIAGVLDGVAAAAPQRVIVVGIGEFAATPLLAQPLRAIAGMRADRLDADVRAAAARAGAIYVNIIEATGSAFVADPAGTHARDGFHPNDTGYGLWAEAILAAIRAAGG